MNNKLIIAIDFDGTCVKHNYPQIGDDIGAVPVLKKIVNSGHKLILYTMRSGDNLRPAVLWFLVNGIELWSVNKNPEQYKWTMSNKIYAHMYIDDTALGIPLIENKNERPYVNWKEVEKILKNKKII